MSSAELLLFQIINLYKVVYTTATMPILFPQYYLLCLLFKYICRFIVKKKKLASDGLLGNHLLITSWGYPVFARAIIRLSIDIL